MHNFVSAFGEKLNSMLDFRETHGYKRESYLRVLIRFDRYCSEQFYGISELTRQILHSWLDNEAEKFRSYEQSASAVRIFGKYLTAAGEKAYILPDKYSPGRTAFTPYNFTDSELTGLFAAADMLPVCESEPFIHEIAPVLFRLIYTCGLRPGEGCNLLTENVRLNSGEILITRTKMNKERIVVMSDDMLALMRKYDLRRMIFSNGSRYFFPSANGEAFGGRKIHAVLNKAWTTAACTPQNPVPKKIRVYDLRHRFASACLNRWLDEGENLAAMLPYLSAYMGHKSMSETEYYIHILPENLTQTSAVDWSKLNAVIPEVTK